MSNLTQRTVWLRATVQFHSIIRVQVAVRLKGRPLSSQCPLTADLNNFRLAINGLNSGNFEIFDPGYSNRQQWTVYFPKFLGKLSAAI